MNDPVLRFLTRVEGPPEEEALAAVGPIEDGHLELLEGVALGREGAGPWARIAAVRLLGRARVAGAASALLRVLDGSSGPEDRLCAESMVALEGMGPGGFGEIVQGLPGLRGACRDLAFEVALRLAADYELPRDQAEALRNLLERQFRHARHPGDRVLYAGYLGDLGEPEAVAVLLEGLKSVRLTPREYEGIREAVERLGDECPDFYFDRDGRGYPVDAEGHLFCPVCGEPLRIDHDSGLPSHLDGSPAAH